MNFSISSSGLGYRLNFYSTSYNTNGTFAMLLVMMALMMGLNALDGNVGALCVALAPGNDDHHSSLLKLA